MPHPDPWPPHHKRLHQHHLPCKKICILTNVQSTLPLQKLRSRSGRLRKPMPAVTMLAQLQFKRNSSFAYSSGVCGRTEVITQLHTSAVHCFQCVSACRTLSSDALKAMRSTESNRTLRDVGYVSETCRSDNEGRALTWDVCQRHVAQTMKVGRRPNC